jgi:glycosyltransferase involved in cell wall biosynthesis
LVGSGGGGVLVAADDAEAMADAIVQLVSLPDPAWREMSDKAFATASRYTWDDATDLFEAALKTAVQRARRGELVAV